MSSTAAGKADHRHAHVAPSAPRLLHITDTHLHAARDTRLRGVDTFLTLSRVLDRARRDPHAAQAVLATGDLSQDETPASYAAFRELLAPLDIPVWCLPGNHDEPRAMRAALAEPQFRVGGAHVIGNWCVILLDSYLAGDHGGRLAPAHLQWLDATLQTATAPHVLVAIHHHPLPLGSGWLDELGLYNADALLEVLDRCPRLRAVVAGHVHQASDLSRNGVRYLTTPSTCFQFQPESDVFAVDRRPPGFRWLDLQSDGSIDTEVVWAETDR